MKPKDLQPLFTFEQRHPMLADHIFYVPVHYKDYGCFTFPNLNEYFGNTHSIHIEYCSGNGDWIVEKALSHPNQNWIAVERRFDRVRKIWSKLKNYQLTNLLIVAGEAFTFTHHYLAEERVEEVFMNFPDPWPKTKHAKKRLIQLNFLNELSRILKQGKKLTIVTDDPLYVTHATALFCAHPDFISAFPSPFFEVDRQDYGHSWFEQLWKEQGKQIHYMEFIKQHHGCSDSIYGL